MATEFVCSYCGESFTGSGRRVFCSMACRNKAPSRLTPEGKARIGARTRGIKLPPRSPEHAAKIAAAHRASGRFAGPNNANFKGEWIKRPKDDKPRAFVWISPEERALYGVKSATMRRAHLVWLRAHPGETIKRGEMIHHKNDDSLDDRPENLVKIKTGAEHTKTHAALHRDFGIRRRNRRPDKTCEVCETPVRAHRRFCSVDCTAIGQSGERNPHFGRQHSDAVKEAQRTRATGKKVSPETREKMRQAHIARWAKAKAERS